MSLAISLGFTRTFFFYMARRFTFAVIATYGTVFMLIMVIDFVEQLRGVADVGKVGVETIALLTLYRVPGISEVVLPFAVLIAAMFCFIELSRKLELVVVRAAGMSAWQFLSPALVCAVLIGILAATAYNPLVNEMRTRSIRLEAQIFGRATSMSENRDNVWMRQSSAEGQAVINARSASDGGRTLSMVNVIVFNTDNSFRERIDAQTAVLKPGFWDMRNVQITPVGREPKSIPEYRLPTNLTADQVRDNFSIAEDVSFWELPKYIAMSKAAGLPSSRFELQYQTLLARPALLLAMVLLAASSSLRFVRLGGVAQSILGGVVAGFLLYVASEVSGNLGRSGLVNPVLAAWTPALLGALMGFMVLLNQEDG
jgi:lipopolysaccharide export system permease protein